ncbi:MAG: sulfite exporter TauE/SafE family protein [Alphaproteobacteria bacterium]
MDITATASELVMLGVALLGAGAIAGVLAGMFGIGGGAVIVPVLVEFLAILRVDEDVQMHLAVGTSLGIIVPTSIRSFRAHLKRGVVDKRLLRSWLIPVPLGVAAASLYAAGASGETLKIVFAVMALTLGLRMLVGFDRLRLGSDLPGQPWRTLVGATVGFLSALMGIGGGVINNTFMTLFGRPIHQAVATSAGVGALIAIPGVVGYIAAGWGAAGLPPFSVGYVNLLGVALVIPVTMLTAPLGARLAHAMTKRHLEAGFGLFLLLVAARFIAGFLG